MRFLILRAYDIYDNDKPDVVYLDFYDDALSNPLASEAVLFDINGDGKLDWKLADDINNNGIADALDEAMAWVFAQQYMAFNWCSPKVGGERCLKVFAEDFNTDGIPDTVRLHFHQGVGELSDDTLAYTAAFYLRGDGSGDGTHVSWDVNNDGKTNSVDVELVGGFCRNFLVFNWHDARRPKPPKTPCKPVFRRPQAKC